MSVSKAILSVFTVLALAITMAILYDVLLAYNPQFEFVHTSDGSATHGALWQAAHSIQRPISAYYHNYCYVPNALQTMGVDEALGRTYNFGDYSDAPANLQSSNVDPSAPTGVSEGWYYSTGWQ